MAERNVLARAARIAALLGLGFSLIGCESIRQATGAAKLPPDEFTVLTKAPLIIPPDYNLRPPQPGIASRNEVDADDQARAALFPQNAATAAAALGTAYSDGEKLLLTKTNALTVDPDIRRRITSDAGQEDLALTLRSASSISPSEQQHHRRPRPCRQRPRPRRLPPLHLLRRRLPHSPLRPRASPARSC